MTFEKCTPENIPARLREQGRFCLWRSESGRKIPYNPRTGGKAQPNNPDTFSSYKTALEMGQGYTGMGIGIFGTLAAIDIDHCITGGRLSPMAAEIIKAMNSYTERSPSGDGVHILFMAPGLQFDTGRYYTKNSGAGLEIYVAGMTSRYMTITGDRISGSDIEERAAEAQAVIQRYMQRPQVEQRPAPAPTAPGAGLSLTDTELIARAKMAKNGGTFTALWNGDTTGYPSHSEADQALCNMLAFWTQGDEAQIDRLFKKSGLMRDKWNVDKYRERTISTAIARCNGTFYTPITQAPQKPQEKPQEATGAKEAAQMSKDITPAERATSSPQEGAERPQRRSSVELFDTFMEKIRTAAYKPISTGIAELDKLLGGGFDPQSLVMIGAAPGMGKTSLTQQIFETMAENGTEVIFLNLEMSREQLLARSLSREAAGAGTTITAAKIMRGYSWSDTERAVIESAAERYRERIAPRMKYNPDNTAPTVEALRKILQGELERVGRRSPAPIVVLDYLQLVQAEKHQDAVEAIKETVQLLKKYAIEGSTVACAILAFNRDSNRAGKVTMESGRDTSTIEYSADTLLGLNYVELEADGKSGVEFDDLQSAPTRKLVLKLLKKRMTAAGGKLYLDFEGSTSTFRPTAESEREPERTHIEVKNRF